MHSNVKSEECLPVMNARRVAIFQASLKLAREKARAQLSDRDNQHSISDDLNLCDDDEVPNPEIVEQ